MTKSSAQKRREEIIDESLKRVYCEAVDDCMPDRFQALLDALSKEDTSKPKQE